MERFVKRWAFFIVMAGIMSMYGVVVYRSTDPKNNPKPAHIASYVVHWGNPICHQRLLEVTHGAIYGSTDIGQWLQLKKIVESCGGHVELEKNS